MNENKRFSVDDFIKNIIDEEYVNYLTEVLNENEELKQQLQKIQGSFEVNITQNYKEFNKDKLYIKDTNTKLHLNDGNLFIEVYIPQIKEYYCFKYKVTGRNLMREFIENYNSKGDSESENKQITDVYCSETGEIGFTENDITKKFASHEFEKWLNNLIKDNKELTETFSFADMLIRYHCDEKGRKMWDKFNEQSWEEYKSRVE